MKADDENDVLKLQHRLIGGIEVAKQKLPFLVKKKLFIS